MPQVSNMSWFLILVVSLLYLIILNLILNFSTFIMSKKTLLKSVSNIKFLFLI